MAVKETTTTYTWPDGGVIKRIDVRMQKNGFAVAYLYADDREEERDARTNIRAALRLKGWGTLSDSRNGEFVLRVAGLRSGDELVDALQRQGFITTSANVQTQDAEPEPKGFMANVRSRTLRWSGIIATLGNSLSFAEGVLRKIESNKRRVAAGEKPEGFAGQIKMAAAFEMADLPLALVDEHDNSRQLNLLLKKLAKEYKNNGIEVPNNASIYVETSDKNKSLIERGQDFLHSYANQIKCGLEVVASYYSIQGGREQGNKHKVIAGAIFGPGFLASLLIPEKKIDEDKYAQAGTLSRWWMRIQSNPLSVGGLLGYSNTVATYLSAHDEGQRLIGNRPAKYNTKDGSKLEPSKYYKMDYVIPSVMIGANGLYAASKKTVGGDIKSDAMVQDAYRIASQIINKQPGELREKAMEITAKFFGERMEIKEHYPEARQRLIQELDSQRQNPWFELQGLSAYTPKPKRSHLHSADTVAQATVELPVQVVSAVESPVTQVTAKDSVHAGHVEHAAELAQNHA